MSVEPDIDASKMSFVMTSLADAPTVPGRRAWVEYRDLGVAEASCGLVSTQRMTTTQSKNKETGWHYHACTFQWTYLIEGWVDLQLEDGTTRRHEAGSVMFLPGGFGHNETGTSEKIDIIEIFMPPHPETISIDVPEAWRTEGTE
jgi:quercetin dioxygenase-like cupin family protein